MTAEPSDIFELRHAATDRATIVVVPERRMLAIDRLGDPRASDFLFAGETLRSARELLRARVVREHGVKVPPAVLECAWWTHPEPPSADLAAAFADRRTWHWQQMVEVPPEASDEDAAAAIEDARSGAAGPAPFVRLIRFAEGRSAQILHVGGPATQPRSVQALYEAVAAAGLRPHGHLHEIRTADHDRVPDGRARSILRLPIES
ncbi:MAG TPA: hypothetical protein VFO78_11130 [Candidatus Limnocylindrales bacterium]|nr:hypothetical protein [Candidatus Limnocylindrales bacterium]